MDKKYISCLVNDKVGVCAISLVLDKRHVRNGGKYPIALRFTIDRKRLYYPLGDKYTEKEFDAICRAKLLQKSEMRKDIVIELSYKGFG